MKSTQTRFGLQVVWFLAIVLLGPTMALADCSVFSHVTLDLALGSVAPDPATNGGFGLNMWATVVDRDGVVCAIARTGNPGDQWPGSRVISAQKANTANAFSLPGIAISTANLFSAVQPGGSLFGLQESNPVDTSVAYVGSSATWGTENDDLVGEKIGGVNVFGGGLALYDESGLIGAIGVSGDTSCADHVIAWRTREALGLDDVPAGPNGGFGPGSDDNIIYDVVGSNGNFRSMSGFGHPTCSPASPVP